MKQSKYLVDGGNMLRVFLLGIVLAAIYCGCILVVGWLSCVLMDSLWQHVSPRYIAIGYRYTRVGLGFLFLPLGAVAHALLYYDLRARKRDSALKEHEII